ncbi:hypothetical protein ACCS53_37860, partial [Rhizobium ruizarguesonis]
LASFDHGGRDRGFASPDIGRLFDGEADLAFSIAPQDATNQATDKVYTNSDTSMFRLSVDVPPLNDVRVRKEINLAIDRNAFLGSVISSEA